MKTNTRFAVFTQRHTRWFHPAFIGSFLALCSAAVGQEVVTAAESAAAELAEKLSNPVAALISVPI
jgi:hypothetical protein